MAMTFTFTEQHQKLLRRMVVGWGGDEFGAPEIDPKRPYGNGDVYGDMCEILGLNEPLVSIELLDELHHETQTALEILLQIATIAPGTYVASDKYDRQWELLGEEPW